MKTRKAFTMVELLMVISIITLLAAILVPAVASVKRRANEARVRIEIGNLESGVLMFRSLANLLPPSQIVIHLTGDGWKTDPRSTMYVRTIWPQFDFNMGGPNSATTGTPGVHYPVEWTSDRQMNSGECLLFFLGGIYEPGYGMVGFSKNPQWPFQPRSAATNRTLPLYDFTPERIIDYDKNGIPEFKDTLAGQTAPYLYFSSYEGSYNVPAELPAGGTLLDVYRQSKQRTTPGPLTRTMKAYNPMTCQIVSPGYDGKYGLGGVYDPNQPLLLSPEDLDNITNFSAGCLGR